MEIKDKEKVKAYYNEYVEKEWNRIAGRPEFLITASYLDKYISKGDKVLDIGGGPGRYSLYLSEKGCDVTLFDLAEENIEFAKSKAAELDLHIKTVCGDACIADLLLSCHKGEYDYILLMGPMYHLLDEKDRTKALNAALALLKPGGVIFVSFINLIAGYIYEMKYSPEMIIAQIPSEIEYKKDFLARKSYFGDAFTKAFFIEQGEVLEYMSRFPLEKLHLIGQEGILSPCEGNIMKQPDEIIKAWVELSVKVCDREELLSWSEHIMYIGRKMQ